MNRSGVKLSSLANWLMLASWLSVGKKLKAEEWRAGLRQRKCSRLSIWKVGGASFYFTLFFFNMIFIIKYTFIKIIVIIIDVIVMFDCCFKCTFTIIVIYNKNILQDIISIIYIIIIIVHLIIHVVTILLIYINSNNNNVIIINTVHLIRIFIAIFLLL